MPKYLISYRKVEGAGQKPEWASFTAQTDASLEAKAIKERVEKRISVLYRRGSANTPCRSASGTCADTANIASTHA